MTPLHELGQAIRDALQLIPMPVVRLLFLALPAAILIWLLRLPRTETVMPGADEKATGFDLRWPAAVALIVQLVIYAVF